jgi:phosphoglycolate phosphatase
MAAVSGWLLAADATKFLRFPQWRGKALGMRSFPFDIVGFDLDGTLFDTSIELTASLNHALTYGGYAPVDPATTRQLVGMGARHMLTMALEQQGGADQARVRALMPVLIDHYEANLGSDCPPFPGLIAALDWLADEGVTLAIVTNKFEHLATKLVTNLGMIDRFKTVIGGDTMGKGNGKPKPDPIIEMIRRCRTVDGGARAAFVGDSIHDVHAAQAAGIPCIALSFGFLTR